MLRDRLKNRINFLGLEDDRHQPILAAIVEKDVRKRRRDNRTESIILQRPHRMLARAARTEVRASNQNFRAPVLRLVEHEAGIVLAFRREAPTEKEAAPESTAHHRF